jgi:hypothetical protein
VLTAENSLQLLYAVCEGSRATSSGFASRPSGEWGDDDYDVLAEGKVIGRIYEGGSASTPPELRWFWSITEVVRVPDVVTHGHAPTLDSAKAKLRENWTKAQNGPIGPR